ncbi:LytR/AlgR family response regulator transcription factor [Mucilaginibacter sp. P25]|uniref:DNA-binding response regulator, LytR/AlgR family n=1 Tax=Mucilaginibacter gossypii TaxID=551996 RepID=A0A1G8BN48_9SPHI|nr:response regulator transcription factor [Mucilaginibacter gossypii]SDH34478.1 DNA-binding response regulator, LytR/AlgR family [Mucilaginibacter gossypii]
MNYLIVDDEPQARKLLQAYMENLSTFHLVRECENVMEAFEALHSEKIDMMFLDIKMPIISGTDFLRSLKNPPLVIFTTAYNKYAIEGYELNVVDYLLKPIALPRLLLALEKVQDRFRQRPVPTVQFSSYFFVKVGLKLLKVNFEEILLIEGMQNYCKLHLKDKVLVAGTTMKAMAETLPSASFIRVHRSYIVPVITIKAINGNTIETSYKEVPIGVNYRSAILKYANPK